MLAAPACARAAALRYRPMAGHRYLSRALPPAAPARHLRAAPARCAVPARWRRSDTRRTLRPGIAAHSSAGCAHAGIVRDSHAPAWPDQAVRRQESGCRARRDADPAPPARAHRAARCFHAGVHHGRWPACSAKDWTHPDAQRGRETRAAANRPRRDCPARRWQPFGRPDVCANLC